MLSSLRFKYSVAEIIRILGEVSPSIYLFSIKWNLKTVKAFSFRLWTFYLWIPPHMSTKTCPPVGVHTFKQNPGYLWYSFRWRCVSSPLWFFYKQETCIYDFHICLGSTAFIEYLLGIPIELRKSREECRKISRFENIAFCNDLNGNIRANL